MTRVTGVSKNPSRNYATDLVLVFGSRWDFATDLVLLSIRAWDFRILSSACLDFGEDFDGAKTL